MFLYLKLGVKFPFKTFAVSITTLKFSLYNTCATVFSQKNGQCRDCNERKELFCHMF